MPIDAPASTPVDPGGPDDQPGDAPAGRPGPLGWLFRALAGLVIAASFGVWAYAYSGLADRPPPDVLADTDVPARAESICADALGDVAALPSALDASDEVERAEQIRRSTDRFAEMLDDLDTLEPTGPDDPTIWNGWLSDWRVLVGDRYAYADRLAADPDAQLYLTKVTDNERLDKRLTRVANENRMPSCAAPTDV